MNNLISYVARDLHSVPSYKEQSYKERLVNLLQTKERRLVEIEVLKEHHLQKFSGTRNGGKLKDNVHVKHQSIK